MKETEVQEYKAARPKAEKKKTLQSGTISPKT